MKKIKSYYKSVNSFVGLKTDRKYSTTNYGMFSTLKYNRGADKGIDNLRLNNFKKLIESNLFYFSWVNVIVNMNGVIVDGHHRFTALKEAGLPVNFEITPEPALNVTDEVLLMGAISRLNSVDSKWNSKAHFDAALKTKQPVAIAIAELKAGLNAKYDLDKRPLREGRIYALITKDRKRLESKLTTVEDYAKMNVLELMSTDTFKEEFDFVCQIMEEIKAWNAIYKDSAKMNEFFMIRAVMPFVWDNMLNMEMFLAEMKKVKFANVANTKNGCKVYVQKIQKRILKIK